MSWGSYGPQQPQPESSTPPLAAASDAQAPATPAQVVAKPWRVPWIAVTYLQFGLLALAIALFVITFIVQAFRIPSGSMEDTLLVRRLPAGG